MVLTGADPYYEYSKDGMMTLTEQKDIENIRTIHKLLIEEGDARKEHDYRNFTTITIHYKLKNGTTLTRYYYTANNSAAIQRLQEYTNSPEFILGYATPEEMLKYLQCINLFYQNGMPPMEDPVWMEKMVNALFADAEAGTLTGSHAFVFEIQLDFEYEDGHYGGQYINIPQEARNTVSCLEEYKAWCLENKNSAA